MSAEFLLHNIDNLYTLHSDNPSNPLGQISNAAIAFADREIVYLGPSKDAPYAEKSLDASGYIVMPGLVDCHTHAIYGGSRSAEFAQRLAGVSYSTILEQGGGIHSTVRSTRSSTEEQLRSALQKRLENMVSNGVTSVEIKSGYGLDLATEMTMLQISKKHGIPISTVSTYLAHTIPMEYKNNRSVYIEEILEQHLPSCTAYAQMVDVYCDRGAFTVEETVQILEKAKSLGLSIRAHAEQVTHTGISGIVAQMGGTCVDHLERATQTDLEMMAQFGCVGVLLPGAQLYLRDTPPPTHLMREMGIPMAVATDLNPGSSPIHDIWTASTLSCLLQQLTIPEAVLGITKHAGQALGYNHLGWLGTGSAVDCILLRPPPGEPATIESVLQHMGAKKVSMVIKNGRPISIASELAKNIR